MSEEPATISIRPAVPADVPQILRFIQALAEYEKLEHTVIATEAALREHLFGPHPAAEVLIADLNNQPVGFALFFQTFSTFLAQPGIWLEDLYVFPGYRGYGVGRGLLAELARITQSRDCGRLEWSVLKWNKPAIGFYNKLGAIPLDDWTIYRVTGDALEKIAEI